MAEKDRIGVLQEAIRGEEIDGLLLFYSRDILYYTGTAQPSYLAVLPDDFMLFVRSGFEFAGGEVFIDAKRIREERRLKNIFHEYFKSREGKFKRIGTELDMLTVSQFREMQAAFPEYEIVDASALTLNQRKRKDPSEIEKTRKACGAIDRGHKAAMENLKEGITELELAAAVENAHRLAGHEGIFFIRQPDFFMSRGPISSGANLFKISGVVYTITGVGLSPSVPAGPSQKKITGGEAVMIDIPVLVDGYHADQTRTYCIGKAPSAMKAMHDDLKAIADHLIDRMKPGDVCSDIFKMAVDMANRLGRSDQFQGFGRGKRSRLIGHGIGLELNEPPIPSEYDSSRIEDGFVIALDMHMMDEDSGVVKLEDMILISEGGNEILTITPRKLFEV
jgi:Xaa-Pro dipeptidase